MYIYITVYRIAGTYGHGHHYLSTNSVEVYLPWNDTWIDLPTLPDISKHDGSVVPMTDTNILSLDIASSGNRLHLVGGESMNWNTGAMTDVKKVYRLEFDRGNKSYSWSDHYDHEMGKCGLWCSHLVIILFLDMYMQMVGGNGAVGVPDTFFASFHF